MIFLLHGEAAAKLSAKVIGTTIGLAGAYYTYKSGIPVTVKVSAIAYHVTRRVSKNYVRGPLNGQDIFEEAIDAVTNAY